MIAAFLFSTCVDAFELQIGQNWEPVVTPGSTIRFDLVQSNGQPSPSNYTENYDITLLDGREDLNNAKTLFTLLPGQSKTTGIEVTLPYSLTNGNNYFLGIVSASGSKYSGVFGIDGYQKPVNKTIIKNRNVTKTVKPKNKTKPVEATETAEPTETEIDEEDSTSNSTTFKIMLLTGYVMLVQLF